jgi:hypothetical protein
MKLPEPHKTESILVRGEMVEVDVGMLPVVRWINSFKSAFTQFCCEGSKEHEPYVLFYCEDKGELMQVLKKLHHPLTDNLTLVLARCEADVFGDGIRYKITFGNKKYLRKFVSLL